MAKPTTPDPVSPGPYPVALMPTWLRALTVVNPLSYEVNALRGLLLGSASNLPADFIVLLVASILGIAVASSLLPRLAR